jgi:hypothetical protein
MNKVIEMVVVGLVVAGTVVLAALTRLRRKCLQLNSGLYGQTHPLGQLGEAQMASAEWERSTAELVRVAAGLKALNEATAAWSDRVSMGCASYRKTGDCDASCPHGMCWHADQ